MTRDDIPIAVVGELRPDKPAYLTGFRREGGEVLRTVVFSIRGARSRTQQYVERPEARKRRWAWCIAGRSRKLVRYAG